MLRVAIDDKYAPLSKGYKCIHRFSEDIDIKIEPDEDLCGFQVYRGKNHDKEKHQVSRRRYFDWVCKFLDGKISGINGVARDEAFDDPKYRNGGIRIYYNTEFANISGIKEGILLEVGFDRTAPNQTLDIGSWALERALESNVLVINNKVIGVPCYEPEYTFVEKLQAVVRKYRQYKESGKESLPLNSIRHYYDLYQLIDRDDVQAFIGTPEYEEYKVLRFGSDDTKVSNSDALKLTCPKDKQAFEIAYNRTEGLYYRGRPTLDEILSRFSSELEKL